MLVCGDFNQVTYPFLEKSPFSSSRSPSKLTFQQLLHRHSPGYEYNPTRRQYTHYSHPHNFSCIDHIFISTGSSPLLSSLIVKTPWSDHNAFLSSLGSLTPKQKDRTWCLNATLLAHLSHKSDIATAIKDHVSHNKMDDVTLSGNTLFQVLLLALPRIIIKNAGLFIKTWKRLSSKPIPYFKITLHIDKSLIRLN